MLVRDKTQGGPRSANPADGASVTVDHGGFYGEWRFQLDLWWKQAPKLVFVLMNPAEALKAEDLRRNPTVRRCCDIAQKHGYGSVRILNLFCFRSAHSDFLYRDPVKDLQFVGPEADLYLMRGTHSWDVVCGWGSAAPDWRAKEALDLIYEKRAKLFCLGQTKQGKPLHPIANRAGKELLPYNAMFYNSTVKEKK